MEMDMEMEMDMDMGMGIDMGMERVERERAVGHGSLETRVKDFLKREGKSRLNSLYKLRGPVWGGVRGT